MPTYRVTFFKHLVSSDGHPFRCPQRTIQVRLAKTRERAIRAAQCRYARLARDRDWRIHADSCETEIIENTDQHLSRGPSVRSSLE
jgi:hypothetical protein